jgi:hypothetical protein
MEGEMMKKMEAFVPPADCVRFRHFNSVRKRTDPVAISPLSTTAMAVCSLKKEKRTKQIIYLCVPT